MAKAITIAPNLKHCSNNGLFDPDFLPGTQDTAYEQPDKTKTMLSAKEAISLYLLGSRKVCSLCSITKKTIIFVAMHFSFTVCDF